jgi:hypothetical protein
MEVAERGQLEIEEAQVPEMILAKVSLGNFPDQALLGKAPEHFEREQGFLPGKHGYNR